MAEKNIISKPFTITRREGSTTLQDIFYVETRGKQSGNTFLPPDGKSSADLDVYRKITLDEYNGVLALGEENRSLLKTISSSDPNNPDTYLIKNATIENGQVTPTQVAPERVLRNPNILLSPSIQSSQASITNSGLTDNSNISPNTATQSETTSAPINVPTSQADVRLGSSDIKTYPINMKNDQDRIEFTVWKYKNRGLTTPDITSIGQPDFERIRSAGFVYLPVTKISDTNSVNWSEDGLNELQKGFANVSYLAMGTDEDAKKKLGDQASALLGIGGDAGFATLSRLYLAGQAVSLNNLLTRATGAILNPNLELLFKGPVLRQFGFGFDLLAKSKNEADRIKEIIKFFKQNMAVRNFTDEELISARDNPDVTPKNLFLNSPYVFGIKYLAGATQDDENAAPHQSIGKIKECALLSCTTDYTPMGSYMTFDDTEKTMFMYRINLQFKELTPVYSSDYTDNHPIGF